ncbi:MAG: type IV toxin-antitoxin system AbiEi family antitoxin domain-containing protein [Actinomycetes bacterium]
MKAPPTSGARRHRQLRELLRAQHGVLSYGQAQLLGISHGTIRSQVSAGRWVVLSPGVYFTVNGRPGVSAQWWAALLASGEGAVLSHWTAASLYGFGRANRGIIEVSIPSDRQEVSLPGVRLRRSRLLPHKATTHQGWPVTTAADTVLDLAAGMRSPHDVVALLTDACREKAVSAAQIIEALAHRKRQRHRQLVKDVLGDVLGGVESILEHRYLVRVERPHGLPPGRRQAKENVNGVVTRKDVEYDEYLTVVELDGRLGHEGSGRHRDRRRDNSSTRRGKATLRYGHADLEEPCQVAAEVAEVLRGNGWAGVLQRCGPRCTATTC